MVSSMLVADMKPHDATGQIDTSIVMATCSRVGMLRDAMASLLREALALGRPVEFVIVDDGSTDETPAFLREFERSAPMPVRILQGERQGVAAARNLGSRAARGEWLASFDDDQIALPGWLTELRAMAESSRAAVVGGSLQLTLPNGVAHEELGPRARKVLGEHHPGETAHNYEGSHLPATNNVLIRRDVFVELGGYDVAFTEGAEDTDFFRRVRSAGYTMRYQPASSALHVMPAQRLSANNLRWTSMRLGASDARLYRRQQAVLLPLKWAMLRVGTTVFRDLPHLALAKARGSRSGVRDAQCSLWYSTGLLRALPALMSGRADRSEYLRSLNFRKRNGERA